MRRLLTAASFVAALVALISTASAVAKHNPPKPAKKGPAKVSVFATGFNNPRGLAFGPDGNLYVAEGGLGGSDSTVGQCTQAAGAAAPYTGSTNNPVMGGRISKVSPAGARSTVVDSLPSSETSAALGNLVSGVSSVAFIGNQLYGLLAGAGCSHGVPTVPNGVIKVGPGSTWSMLADLSAFQAAHPVANPDPGDFEPDGTWYSMAAYKHALYPMDSNHGELDRVKQDGTISRVVDISAKVGHVVPTAIVRHGVWYIGNLGLFGPQDGTTANEHAYMLTPSNRLRVRASGLEQVLGLAFRGGKMYALEMSTTPGGPTPGTGAIVRVRAGHPAETVVSGLVFPTGMTVGHDGAFYVSEKGFDPGAIFGVGAGRVLRITTH